MFVVLEVDDEGEEEYVFVDGRGLEPLLLVGRGLDPLLLVVGVLLVVVLLVVVLLIVVALTLGEPEDGVVERGSIEE